MIFSPTAPVPGEILELGGASTKIGLISHCVLGDRQKIVRVIMHEIVNEHLEIMGLIEREREREKADIHRPKPSN